MAWENGVRILLHVLMICFREMFSQTVSLTADPAMPVTEGDRVRFTCQTTGSSRTITLMRSGEREVIVSWITENSQCVVLHPHNVSLYHASCDGANSKYLTEILNVSLDFHHHNIICILQFGNASDDNVDGFVYIKVNVPLKHLELNVSEHLTLQEGHTTKISCTVRSRPTPNFLWLISDQPIHKNSTVTSYNDIIVTSIVRYTGTREDNNGRLQCKANNGITEVTSSVIFLNITYPPNISVTYNLKPIEGTEQFNLTCLVIDSNPTENLFHWFKDEKISGSNNILTVNNLNRSDTNKYMCQATNGIGDLVYSTLFLAVLYKASILKFSNSNTIIVEGGIFNALVDVEGQPAPNVTWSSSTTGFILWTENQVLHSRLNITTRCEDTGNYTCAVDNGVSSPDTVNFRFSVSCKPRPSHDTSNENIQITDGDSLKLNATFVAFPQPNITWYFRRNNSEINYQLIALIYTVSDEARHVSSLSKSNSTHSGQYIVMAENNIGQATTVFSVNIVDAISKQEKKLEAVVATVPGVFVFVCLVAISVICYRKNIFREKERNLPRRSNSEDIYDSVEENSVEKASVCQMQPKHLMTSPSDYSKTHTATTKEHSNVYANVNTSNAYTNLRIAPFQTNDYISYVNTSI